MAHVTGTASNINDAFERLRTQLTTNAALSALSPSQTWQEVKYVYNNVETTSTNATLGANTHIENLLRYDPRFSARNGESDSGNDTQFTAVVNNVSFIRFKMRTAKAVTSLMIKHAASSPTTTMRDFTIQYSDNDTTWTTVRAVTGQLSWAALEERTFSGWAATGAHLYWRILINAVSSGTSFYMRSMSFFNGTELVSSSENISVLKGPGFAGTDEIFTAIVTRKNPLNSTTLMMLFGMTGFLASERSLLKQPGVNPIGQGLLALQDSPMPYWFTMSGRRYIIVFKVGTIYSAGYAGFFYPYASAGQYPYPLMIGGSITESVFTGTTLLPSTISGKHSVFCMPGSETSTIAGSAALDSPSTMAVIQPSGTWNNYSNRPSNSPEGVQIDPYRGVFPQWAWGAQSAGGANRPLYTNVGGGYTLWAHILTNKEPLPRHNLGEIDGTKQVTGHLNASENTGTIDGKDYIIFQNVYRSSLTEYWALLAE